ncbi:c-type cytochrome [Pannonibacter phragmitetus]|uniref:c-type cytochrome n=1 Tax=Pannonibacter phragmitetus TaxID=121719 RepID=UPI003D2EA31B
MTTLFTRGLRAAAGAAILFAAPGVCAVQAQGTLAEAAQVERGKMIAKEACAICHAIGRDDASPNADAPAFRDLGQRYPVEDLAESLAEGIVTGHPDMPEVALEAQDVSSFIAYLKSIQNTGSTR